MNFRDLAITSAFCVSLAGMAGAQSGERFAFDDVDTDADGFVTLEELQAAFDLNVEAQEDNAETVLELQDTDGDGTISREEAGADNSIFSLEEDSED